MNKSDVITDETIPDEIETPNIITDAEFGETPNPGQELIVNGVLYRVVRNLNRERIILKKV